MGGTQVVINAWKEWGLHALVLLSFTLQVALLILAEFRRRIDSGVLRVFVWSAYMLADGVAIYVLGHMSVTSRSPEHQLVAFWAPFLLLHLGGQHNISAYAIEDNRLWLRHLQTLCVQVAAACYVLYESSVVGSGSHAFLRWATILMFAVGVVKYAERVWALRCAGSSPTGRNYRTFEPSAVRGDSKYDLDKMIISRSPSWDTEDHLLMAHRMLDVPMDLLRGPLGKDSVDYPFASDMTGKDLYRVVEMQLSLMHDVFYTKMVVTHSNLYGLCIRILLLVATAIAFLLFHLLIIGGHSKGSGSQHSRLDVAVTYVLLIGAVILETLSLLWSMFSSWTCPLLVSWGRDDYGRGNTPCNSLGHLVTSVRRLVHAASWRRRYWSVSIGQHNLFRLGVGSRASTISKKARSMGVEDWWNTVAYSWSVPVSTIIQELLINIILKGEGVSGRSREIGEPLFDSLGRAELKRWELYKNDHLTWSIDERILVWHIGTNIYLSWWNRKHTTKQPKAEAVEALSNYMVFLLGTRHYMLSPTASRNAYVEVCYGLTAGGLRYTSAEELADKLQSYGNATTDESMYLLREYGSTLDFSTQHHLEAILLSGSKLGAKLISKDEGSSHADAGEVDTLARVWVETLCDAAQQCSAYSHAKQLSKGGELITITALLVKYLTKSHFPSTGIWFDPRSWKHGEGPFR